LGFEGDLLKAISGANNYFFEEYLFKKTVFAPQVFMLLDGKSARGPAHNRA
jgi:hypothetical protein